MRPTGSSTNGGWGILLAFCAAAEKLVPYAVVADTA